MKFGQFIPYYKRKPIIEKFPENRDLKTSSRPFLCLQRIKHNSYWKMKFLKPATYIGYISKTNKICQNQHTELLRFHFREDSLKIGKDLQLVFRPHFSLKFLIKKLFCNVT